MFASAKNDSVAHGLLFAPAVVDFAMDLMTAVNTNNIAAVQQCTAAGMLSNDLALQQAAILGHAQIVALLIPISPIHPKKNPAFRWAAQNNHVECTKLLLPYTTVGSRTKALKAACVFKNQALIDLLAPCSDALRVLNEFHNKPGAQAQYALLRAAVDKTIDKTQ